MAAYAIDVRPRARRSLRQLDPSAQKAIAQAIDGLATALGTRRRAAATPASRPP